MFWIFMLIAGGAATFAALFIHVAWFKVLTIAFLLSAIMIYVTTGGLLWRRLFPKQ